MGVGIIITCLYTPLHQGFRCAANPKRGHYLNRTSWEKAHVTIHEFAWVFGMVTRALTAIAAAGKLPVEPAVDGNFLIDKRAR